MPDDLPTVRLGGVLYVYIDEDCIVRVADILAFTIERQDEFYNWRKQWGEDKYVSTAQQ